MVNVADVLLALPQSSVAVKVTRRAARAAIVAQGCEVVGPGHATADVAGGRTAVAGEPGVEGVRVAGRLITLDRLVGGVGVDGRVRCVLDGERGVVSLLLPQSSVAVKVTVTAPVAPQRSLRWHRCGSTSRHCSCRWPRHRRGRRAKASGEVVCIAGSVALDGRGQRTPRRWTAVLSVTVIVWVQDAVEVSPQWSIGLDGPRPRR